MKSSKISAKVNSDHPVHKLYEAASDIVGRTIKAYEDAKVPVPDSFSLPVWIDGNPVMRITIEIGTKITADYAIFKAQNTEKL